jgi:outer membrane immunogenic protein
VDASGSERPGGVGLCIDSDPTRGIEGSFSGSDIRGEAPCFGGTLSCTAKSNWFGSVSGRFGGLVTDRFLAYVKGGAVWK